MSRHPDENSESPPAISNENITKAYINFIIAHDIPKSMTIEEIQQATKGDKVLTKVSKALHKGHWDLIDNEMKLFHKCADQLTVNHTQDIILKNNRIVIPEKLQNKVIQLAHNTGHLGVERTKSLIREITWFTNLDVKVKEFIASCLPCQTVGQPNAPEPLIITETPDRPWTELSIDYYGPVPNMQDYLLVVVDNYTKYPEVAVVKSTDARVCIPQLDKTFVTHGVPDKIKTDNGPPFNGHAYAHYMTLLGIKWDTSTPLWPQGNGQAESFMKPLGKFIQTATVENKPWKQALQRFLLTYCTTPHSSTKVPPCELLFNRKVKGLLPELPSKKIVNKHKYAQDNINACKLSNKRYQDRRRNTKESDIQVGDIVICKQQKHNKVSPNFSPEQFVVTKRRGTTIFAENDNHFRKRNISYFTKIVPRIVQRDGSESEEEFQHEPYVPRRNIIDVQPEVRRSTRDKRLVQRYGTVIPTDLDILDG